MSKKKATTSKSGGSAAKPAKKKAAPKKAGAEAAGDAYVVLARKYRPNRFEDLIGQAAMVRTLTNAFESERIAQAYMLTGVRGIGKTTTARILARALNYEKDGSSDGPTTALTEEGVHCREIIESRHPDVLELDAASNTSIENIREIIEAVRYKPVSARYKVYIIDEVHMLSKGAFNALLKTLEEPPEHVKFIFATTEIRKVPVTVLSRCQRFDLRRVEIPELIEHFKSIAKNENAKISDDALHMIARSAEGSVRDGLSILDQAIAMGSGSVDGETVRAMLGLADRARIYALLENVLSGDVKASLENVSDLYMDGAEPTQLLSDLADAVHAATRIRTAGIDAAPDSLTTDDRARMEELANKLSVPALARAWQMILKGMGEISDAPDTRVAVEMLLIRMAHMADLPSPDELIRRFGADKGASTSAQGKSAPATNGGGDRPAPQASAEPVNEDPGWQPEGTTTPSHAPVTIESFSALCSLIGERRDAMLLADIEKHVRLVRFEDGTIEVNLTEGAPKNLLGRLGERLKSWTGKRWVVAVSGEEGAPTIAEQKKAEFEKDYNEIKDHPTILAAREHFPDAEITDIRKIDKNEGDSEEPAQAKGSSRRGRE